MPATRRAPMASATRANQRQVTKNGTGRHAVVAAAPSQSPEVVLPERGKRTGRACVHCQQRKTKCDENPDGCANCAKVGKRCETRDPVSNNTQIRGHTEAVELKNLQLEAQCQRLTELLRAHDIELPASDPDESSWSGSGRRNSRNDQNRGRIGSLPEFNGDLLGENFMGIGSNQPLTVPQGTRITLFGNKIDFNDYLLEDSAAYTLTDGEYNNYTTNRVAVEPPQFPPREELERDMHIFFTIVAPYTPAVHPPDLVGLLDRLYDGRGPPLNDAEKVILHMALSITNFQIAVRSNEFDLRDMAKKRFTYSLTHVQAFTESHKLEDLQALTLMCVAMRNLQRPGPAWKLCSRVFQLFIELGMHRSASAWAGGRGEQSEHERHMNQRLFWTMLVITVNINSKFGRPMPILEQYIDVETPEPKPDSLDPSNPTCSWRAAIYGFELTAIMLQVHTQIGALKHTSNDRDTILRGLLESLDTFEQSIPDDLNPNKKSDSNVHDLIAGHYLLLAVNSTKLLLRHPAVLTTTNGWEMSHENLEACLVLCHNIQRTATSLSAKKALDTTLYYNMDLLCAIFMTIFVFDHRHERAVRHLGAGSKGIMLELEREAARWGPVMSAVGQNLGSGTQLGFDILRVFEGAKSRMSERAKNCALATAAGRDPSSTSDSNISLQQTGPAVENTQLDAAHFNNAQINPDVYNMSQRGSLNMSPVTEGILTPPEDMTPEHTQFMHGGQQYYSMQNNPSHLAHVSLPPDTGFNYSGPTATGHGAQMFNEFGEYAFPPGNQAPHGMSMQPGPSMMAQQPNQQWVTYFQNPQNGQHNHHGGSM